MIYLVSVKTRQTEIYAVEAQTEMEALGKINNESVPIESNTVKKKAEVLMSLTEDQFITYGKSKFPEGWSEDLIALMVER